MLTFLSDFDLDRLLAPGVAGAFSKTIFEDSTRRVCCGDLWEVSEAATGRDYLCPVGESHYYYRCRAKHYYTRNFRYRTA